MQASASASRATFSPRRPTVLDDLPEIAQRKRVINLKQGAALRGISVVELRRRIRAGKVKIVKLGARKLGERLGDVLDEIDAATA
jgi:hypothetical protein